MRACSTLLLLIAVGCGAATPADPLVATWRVTTPNPNQNATSQTETWVFTAAHSATRTEVAYYNSNIPSFDGCTETLLATFATWTTSAGSIALPAGSETREMAACTSPSSNMPPTLIPGTFDLSGTWAISGATLTLTLNNSTSTLTRQ